MDIAVSTQNLGKKFRRYHGNRAWTLQEAVTRGLRRQGRAEVLWALRDVNLALPRGSTWGVIGANGAGKSTLLKVLADVLRPDEGTVTAKGRLGSLLDLGAGFHPDLTGRENLFINGIVCGLTHREVEERFDEIVAFAELEEFIESPLRVYSAGMWMRLAFSVAAHIDAEILLIDEALAVGDAHFQEKCLSRFDAFKAQGCTILLVSHDMNMIQRLCDHAIWMDAGRVRASGECGEVVDCYAHSLQDAGAGLR